MLLNRIRQTSRSAGSAKEPGSAHTGEERRGSERRAVNDSAICIPLERSAGNKAFVVGVQWRHHLMEEPLEVVANREAKLQRCSHVYTNGRHGTVYGIVNVDSKDLAQHGTLVPLAVAFAKSVPDKNARSIYVFDMREAHDTGWVYFAEVQRGSPIKEVLCPASKYAALLSTLANNALTPASIFVDTPDEDTFAYISSGYASATQWPIGSISAANVDPIHKVRAFNVTVPQLVFVSLVAVGAMVYAFGIDYYKANMQAKSEEELQHRILQQYMGEKQQAYTTGYGVSPESAIQAVQQSVELMPLFRNGWQFKEATCAVDQGECDFEWTRVYGTFDSFLESASLATLRIDPKDYKVLHETRPFSLGDKKQPEWLELPVSVGFIRENGDRADTFGLASVEAYSVESFTDLVPWRGRGAPPAPVLSAAGWSLSSPIEQVQEAVVNRRIGPEFGVSKVTVTQRDGVVYLKLEGKVYARKS